MEKIEILQALQLYYNLPKDTDFARKLGITPQVLSNWKKRNTFDPELIYTNCLEINPEFILTGRGSIEKNKIQHDFSEPKTERELLIQELADARLQIIELQRAYIEKNEETKKTTTNN